MNAQPNTHTTVYIHACICVSTISMCSVQSLSQVRFFATRWTAAHQASLSITNSQSLPKLMSIESVMPSNHLILCRPLLLLPSIFPNIRVFSNESALRIRWPKYWSFSFNILAVVYLTGHTMVKVCAFPYKYPTEAENPHTLNQLNI